MPRKKPVIIEKGIYLFISKQKELTTHSKHLLITTFKQIFGLGPDEASIMLSSGFEQVGIDSSWPKRSAHSIYKTKHQLIPLKELINKHRVNLTLTEDKVIEHNNEADDTFLRVEIIIKVNADKFPPWYQHNNTIIRKLGNLISTDKEFKEKGYKLLLEAVKDISPITEQHLIETSFKWYRKHIVKPEPLKNNIKAPARAELIVINTGEDEPNPVILLLLKFTEVLNYMPVKFKGSPREKSIIDYLADPSSYFTVDALKTGNQLMITLELSNKILKKQTYKTLLEQDITPPTMNPFTGKSVFSQYELWDLSIPDGVYSLIKSTKLNNYISTLTSTNGISNKSSIEHTLQRFHQHLSLKGFYEQAVPKMFIDKKGAKIKPTKFIMN